MTTPATVMTMHRPGGTVLVSVHDPFGAMTAEEWSLAEHPVTAPATMDRRKPSCSGPEHRDHPK